MACIARALAPAASFGAPTRSRRALRGLPVRSPSSSRDAADVRDAVSPRAFNPFAPPPDLSGDLLSAVAKFALETNLASHASVDAAVDAQVLGLLGGKVDGVVITGRDWRSRRDLTCRSLRFAVGEVSIDQGALLTDRLVKLRSVPTGDAVVEFTPEDFGNFLAHPLTKDARARIRSSGIRVRLRRRRGMRTVARGDPRERRRGLRRLVDASGRRGWALSRRDATQRDGEGSSGRGARRPRRTRRRMEDDR